MTQITLHGWNVGLQKVRLAFLIHEQAGLSLAEGHQKVCELLNGITVELIFESAERAELFEREAVLLGAVTRVESLR